MNKTLCALRLTTNPLLKQTGHEWTEKLRASCLTSVLATNSVKKVKWEESNC